MTDMEKLVERLQVDARPIAIKMAQDIAKLANKRPKEEVVMFGGLVASLVLQNLLTTLAVAMYPPGSKEGEAWLNAMYHECLRDALGRWQKSDLKKHFTKDTGLN
jgi:hypothetical protein